jgi:hypothetical protein
MRYPVVRIIRARARAQWSVYACPDNFVSIHVCTGSASDAVRQAFLWLSRNASDSGRWRVEKEGIRVC